MTGDESFRSAAAELANDPHAVADLLLRHIPDEHRKCRACTTGGTGTRDTAWPCSVHAFASAAQRVIDDVRTGEDGSTA